MATIPVKAEYNEIQYWRAGYDYTTPIGIVPNGHAVAPTRHPDTYSIVCPVCLRTARSFLAPPLYIQNGHMGYRQMGSVSYKYRCEYPDCLSYDDGWTENAGFVFRIGVSVLKGANPLNVELGDGVVRQIAEEARRILAVPEPAAILRALSANMDDVATYSALLDRLEEDERGNWEMIVPRSLFVLRNRCGRKT